MSSELIDKYVDRAAIVKDTDFLIAEIQRAEDARLAFGTAKTKVQGATSSKGVTEGSDLAAKANAQLAESIKAVTALINQRFASEAKLITIQTDYAKATAANRLELQKQNKELKDQAALNAANTGSIERARAAVRLLNTERNKLNLFTKEGQEQQQKLNDKINKYNEFIKKSVDNLSAQKINIGNYQGSAKIIVDALEKEKKKLEELEKTRIRVQNAGAAPFAPRTTVQGFAGGNLKAAAGDVQALNKQIEESRVKIEGFSRITEQPKFLNIAGKVADATAELRFFTKSLIDLERNGLGSSEAANQLRKQLAALTDEIGDTRAEVKALSSDTRGFDLFAGSVSFAADAFQVFAGAAVLAGASEEDAAEATKTLIAVQSVANGVKGIANELTTKGTAANKLYAFAQRQVSIAMDSSATSATRLRAALITTGIGALIVGVGLLVANFSKLKEALGFTNKAQEAYNETLADYKKGAQEAIEKTNSVKLAFEQAKSGVISKDDALKIYNNTLGDTFGKATSLAEAERLYNEKAGTYIQIMGLKAQANTLFAKSAESAAKGLVAGSEDQVSLFDNLTSGFLSAFGQTGAAAGVLAIGQIEGVKKAIKDADDEAKIFYDAAADKVKQATELAKGLNINLDPKTKANGKKDTSAQDALKAAIEEEKKKNAAIKALRIEDANEQIRLNQIVVDNENSTLQQKIIALENISSQRKRIEGLEYADAIKSEVEIQKGKRVEILKSQEEVKLLTVSFGNKISAINSDLLKSQSDAQKAAREKALKQLADDQEKELALLLKSKEKKQAQLDEEYFGRATALNDRFSQGKISQEQFNKEREKLDQDYHAASLRAEIEFTKKFLALMELRGIDVSKERAKLAQLEMQLSEMTKNKVIKDEDEKRAKVLETIDKIQQAYQVIGDIISGALNAAATIQKNRIQDEIDAVEERKNAELKANDAAMISEEKKAANTLIINARAQAQREQLERRQKEIDRQKAQAEKALAVFSILLSTAKNIAAAITPIGKILAAASGAAQLAIAIATPIPRFFRGKSKGQAYEGPGLLNDNPDGHTMEVLEHADGSVEFPSGRNVVTHIAKDDIIHPDKDAWMNVFLNAAHRDANVNIGYRPAKDNSLALAMEKQTKMIVSAIQGKQELHLGAGDRGMVALWKWGASQTKYTDENCQF